MSANIASIIEPHDGHNVALIDGDSSLTYAELRSKVGIARANLASAGLGRNGRMAIIASNETDFVIASLACLGLGGQVIPLPANSPIPEIDRKFASARPDLLVLGETAAWIGGNDLGVPVVDLHREPSIDIPDMVEVDDDDLALLLHTSGVTSEARVAMLSHGNLAWVQQAVQAGGEAGLFPEDVVLASLPFSHIFGLNVVLFAALRAGATIVIERRFDAAESLRLIAKHGVTILAGAPPMWRRWMDAEGSNDSMATVRRASSGAAALPKEVFQGIHERFGIEVAEGYGLTETSPIVTWSRGIPIKPTSVGKVIDGAEVILVEPDGTPVEPDDIGEVVVRSPGVFKGYLDSPDLTSSVLTPDGWFWTGDVGAFDDDGYLYLVDRVKDLIIVSGFNVYPGEVESVLMEHPAVRGAVVTGAADLDTGETVIAHILGDATADELAEHARANLSRYKCPTEYRFVDELPVAPSGKVIRRELR